MIGSAVLVIAFIVAIASNSTGSNTTATPANGFASSGVNNEPKERASDSAEVAGIRAHLVSASRAELARVDRLDHKWRFPHDSATHARATTALLDSAEALLRGSASENWALAAGALNQIEGPLTSAQTTRKGQLQKRMDTQVSEATRAAALEAENAQDAAKWSYSADTDEMTGRTSRMAIISSENTVNFGFPYEGEQHGRLVIRNHPSFGRDVIFQIDEGQILCPSYQDCTVRVRFDDGAPERWTAAGAADHSTTSVFIRASTRFVQRMRAAKVVRIAVPVYQEGQPAFEFRVGGFDNQRYTTGS